MPGTLHLLGDVVDICALPAVELDQFLVEPPGAVPGVHDLLLGAPVVGGALLEQAEGVAVPIAQVPYPGLLPGSREGDDCSLFGQVAVVGLGGDDGGIHGLLTGEP